MALELEDIKSGFFRRLYHELKEKSLSVADLKRMFQEMLGKDYNIIYKYFRGKTQPKADFFEGLVELGFDVTKLMTGERSISLDETPKGREYRDNKINTSNINTDYDVVDVLDFAIKNKLSMQEIKQSFELLRKYQDWLKEEKNKD